MSNNKENEKKETPDQMLRAIQGIFCRGRYSPFALFQEELRKNKKRNRNNEYKKK